MSAPGTTSPYLPTPPAVAGSPRAVRRRTLGAGFGRLPVTNIVLLEVGAALALVLLTVDTGLAPASVTVVLLAAGVACTRWRGRWATQWTSIVVRYLARPHLRRVSTPPAPAAAPPPGPALPAEPARRRAAAPVGPGDPRVGLLRLFVDDLVVAGRTDHEQRPVGLAWHRGTWTAVVLIDSTPAMVSPVGSNTDVPLTALAGCLQDRGVVLDAIQVIWHCYPGGSTLPPDSPALAAYLEVCGSLPAVARRTTWVTVRLDPRRCPSAVQERGGGVLGAHRALLGAVSRVRGALDDAGFDSRVLDTEELLRAGLSGADLAGAAGRGREVGLRESWRGATAGGVGHSSHAISGWRGSPGGLASLTGVRALSTTVALALSPGDSDDAVGLRGLVRLSARSPSQLRAADARLRQLARGSGVRLTPLHGQQAAAVTATLPLGGTA